MRIISVAINPFRIIIEQKVLLLKISFFRAFYNLNISFLIIKSIYFRKIIRLFSSLKGRSPREALIAIVVSISKIDKIAKNAQLHKYLELLVELEAWDSQRINEPDSARRHTALSLLLQVS